MGSPMQLSGHLEVLRALLSPRATTCLNFAKNSRVRCAQGRQDCPDATRSSGALESDMTGKEGTSRAENGESIQPLLRLPAVLQATGLARSTVYRMVAEHTFPAPVK